MATLTCTCGSTDYTTTASGNFYCKRCRKQILPVLDKKFIEPAIPLTSRSVDTIPYGKHAGEKISTFPDIKYIHWLLTSSTTVDEKTRWALNKRYQQLLPEAKLQYEIQKRVEEEQRLAEEKRIQNKRNKKAAARERRRLRGNPRP